MSTASETRVKPKTELPRDVYLSLVDSLFGNFSAMLAGGICVAVAATLSAWKTQDPLLWACAAGRSRDRRRARDPDAPLRAGQAADRSRRRSAGNSSTPSARSRIAACSGSGASSASGSTTTRPSTCSARSSPSPTWSPARAACPASPTSCCSTLARRLRAARARPAAAEQSLLCGDRHPDLAVLPRAAPHHRRPARDQPQGRRRVA